MIKLKSNHKSQTNEIKTTSLYRDARIILISLAILYSIFTVTAFIKTTYFWGINFLYYLPLWQKLLFIGSGGLVFIPNVNDIIFKIYQRIANLHDFIQRRTQKFFPRIIYLLVISICFAGLFFLFRVVSLYHDTVQGISFIKSDTPIVEYYTNIGNMKNKPLLLIYIVVIRFLFYNLLNLSAYWSLAISSILIGLVTIILLDFFLRKLDLNPFHQCIVFVLFFTQSITYYYFGYANYYAFVPLIVFLYFLFVIAYFKNSLSLIYPLLLGICAILTHIGTSFIVPSLVFLIIFKHRDKMPAIFNLFTFYSMRISIIVFLLIFILGYLILSFNLLNIGFLQRGFVSIHSGPNEINLFSIDYLINLLNMLLLHSPIGIVLFLFLLKHLHKLQVLGNVKYLLLWMGIGGLFFNIIFYPQGLYAWDGCAWDSVGYVIMGALLYEYLAKQIKYFTYLSTIIITHALMYFGAWLVLNNNVYSAILHYVDIHPKQISDCLRIVKVQPIRNLRVKNNLLIELEKRATTADEYLGLSDNYLSLNDSLTAEKMGNKADQLFRQTIKNDPENVMNYVNYLNSFTDATKVEPKNREPVKSLYQLIIQLEPNNIDYHYLYAGFLFNIHDYQGSFVLLRKVDSLYQSQNVTLLKTKVTYPEIKMLLTRLSYNLVNYPETIKYFDEGLNAGANNKSLNFGVALSSAIYASIFMENFDKAKELHSMARQNGIAKDINIEKISQVNQAFIEQDYLKLLHLLGSFSPNENKNIRAFTDIENIIQNDILQLTNKFVLKAQYDSLLIYGEKMVNHVPDMYMGYHLL